MRECLDNWGLLHFVYQNILSPSLLNTSVLEYGYVYEEISNEETSTRLPS